ncbi:hypothetical protein OIU78_020457 [Salix suchowensis]|uniref:Uncharacterized protein n=1 Tax=Salix purpurea TaxID=77065 RepID=A0A9Q0WX65_SALPP|nr:hypothetical protein OIU78_020457 [Salix suchowensis]KAJ6699204.1 hypothetical protein OIU79_012464 [Salix purpurea]KAJ6774468.1 hypothetical protein OIU79_017795 [Salix purpurea]
MSFMVSQAQQSFSENEKVNLNHPEVEDNQVLSTSPVSSQLHLKPSAHAMDRDVILKRIRHHKTVNKVKKTLQALAASSLDQENMASAYQQKWQDPQDAFSSP